MVLKIFERRDSWVDNAYEESVRELDSFFELNWKRSKPCLILIDKREDFDKISRRKTENWQVGWSDKNIVFLLCRENYESESSHKYSDTDYRALLKHELAHCFSNVISKTNKPVWLLEGISVFLAGQLGRKKPEKLSKFISFYEKGGKEVYDESGFAVEFLVKKHGKKKLLELLKKAKEADTKKEFALLFKSIYGFELNYENFMI